MQPRGDFLTLIFSLEKFKRQIKPLGMTYDFKEVYSNFLLTLIEP